MPVEAAAALMVLVPLIAFVLSFRTRSRWAHWILRIGGLYFALTAALSVIARNLCVGSLSNGYHNCMGGNTLTQFISFMTPALLFSIMLYLLAGPVLIIVAAICEAIVRNREKSA